MTKQIVAFRIFTSWPTNVIRIEFLLGHAESLQHQALPKEVKGKGEVHPCTGTEALYRPYGP